MPDTFPELLRQLQERDFLLIVLLIVIGLLYRWADAGLRDYEAFMRDHPGPAGQFKAWKLKRDFAAHSKRPTSVICPIHKVFRDTCPPGSHDEVDQ